MARDPMSRRFEGDADQKQMARGAADLSASDKSRIINSARALQEQVAARNRALAATGEPIPLGGSNGNRVSRIAADLGIAPQRHEQEQYGSFGDSPAALDTERRLRAKAAERMPTREQKAAAYAALAQWCESHGMSGAASNYYRLANNFSSDPARGYEASRATEEMGKSSDAAPVYSVLNPKGQRVSVTVPPSACRNCGGDGCMRCHNTGYEPPKP